MPIIIIGFFPCNRTIPSKGRAVRTGPSAPPILTFARAICWWAEHDSQYPFFSRVGLALQAVSKNRSSAHWQNVVFDSLPAHHRPCASPVCTALLMLGENTSQAPMLISYWLYSATIPLSVNTPACTGSSVLGDLVTPARLCPSNLSHHFCLNIIISFGWAETADDCLREIILKSWTN